MPLLWIIAFEVISYGIGWVTRANMGWYEGLNKSALNPPDYIFPVVWTILYAGLAVSGYLCMRAVKENKAQRSAATAFWAQMIMNWGWSFVFFQFHLVELGFYWIMGLVALLGVYIYLIWPANKLAALLAAPVVAWGGFAAYLNYSIWILN